MQFLKKSESIFLLIPLVMIAVQLLFWGESIIVDVFGFTVLFDNLTFSISIGVVMLTYWAVYKIFPQYLPNQSLKLIHIIITTLGITYLILTTRWELKSQAASEVQASIMSQLMKNQSRTIQLSSIKGIIFLLGQLALIINIVVGVNRKK